MKTKSVFLAIAALLLIAHPVYSNESAGEESQQNSKSETRVNPVKEVASGVKTIGSGPAKLVKETVKGSTSDSPVSGTVEGVGEGASQLVDSTIKGTYKVATLGYGNIDHIDVENPPAAHGELNPTEKSQPTRFKIKIPGS